VYYINCFIIDETNDVTQDHTAFLNEIVKK